MQSRLRHDSLAHGAGRQRRRGEAGRGEPWRGCGGRRAQRQPFAGMCSRDDTTRFYCCISTCGRDRALGARRSVQTRRAVLLGLLESPVLPEIFGARNLGSADGTVSATNPSPPSCARVIDPNAKKPREQVSRWVMSRLKMDSRGQGTRTNPEKETEDHSRHVLCLDETHVTGAACISGIR